LLFNELTIGNNYFVEIVLQGRFFAYICTPLRRKRISEKDRRSKEFERLIKE
jgi:hypothetical protein